MSTEVGRVEKGTRNKKRTETKDTYFYYFYFGYEWKFLE